MTGAPNRLITEEEFQALLKQSVTVEWVIDLLTDALTQPITDGSDESDEGSEASERSEAEPTEAVVVEVDAAQEYLNRLIEERHELANRLMKLDAMIGKAAFHFLKPADKSDLHEQASFMRGYLAVVDRRLARANGHYGKFQSGFGTFAAE